MLSVVGRCAAKNVHKESHTLTWSVISLGVKMMLLMMLAVVVLVIMKIKKSPHTDLECHLMSPHCCWNGVCVMMYIESVFRQIN